jgi:hypothetical protein
MAQIYGPLQSHEGEPSKAHLPTVSELGRKDRMRLAFDELDWHVSTLKLSVNSSGLRNAWSNKPDNKAFLDSVRELNLQILEKLVDNPMGTAAYELGRALSDTCWLPTRATDADEFFHQFGRHRLATLKRWLGEAGSGLPAQSAAIASRSLQNWQDWADANARTLGEKWTAVRPTVRGALETQGHHWRGLLTGDVIAGGQPGIGAWLLAGEAMLRTLKNLVRKILRHFWLVAAVILAAIGGLLYLSIANSQGTAKVWTTLVTVAGGFGVSATGLRTAATRLGTEIEQPVWQAADRDARAWAVTWLPTLPQGRVERYQQQYLLRQRGVAPPSPPKRLEAEARRSHESTPMPSSPTPPGK